MRTRHFVAGVVCLSVSSMALAEPREAAFATSGDRPMARSGAFAGATLRIGLGSREERAGSPKIGLQLAPALSQAGETMRIGQGLALTAAAKPRVTLAGQELKTIGKRNNLDGTTTALLVGGAVLIVVLVAVAMSNRGDGANAAFD